MREPILVILPYFISLVIEGIGGAFYATRFPENNNTGKYDYIVHFINFLIIY